MYEYTEVSIARHISRLFNFSFQKSFYSKHLSNSMYKNSRQLPLAGFWSWRRCVFHMKKLSPGKMKCLSGNKDLLTPKQMLPTWRCFSPILEIPSSDACITTLFFIIFCFTDVKNKCLTHHLYVPSKCSGTQYGYK